MDSQKNSDFKTSRDTKKYKDIGVYMKTLITKQLTISSIYVNKNIKETLENVLKSTVEGKCIVEGYIKPNTVNLITFSSGLVKGNNIIFETVVECYVCSPVEGMKIKCVAKHINKY